jgi:steroid delta-isomerase-like uncharacterized protein
MTSHELNTEAANQAAVLRLYDECLNQGKYNAADELIAAQFVVPGPDGGTGAEGFKANANRLRTAFPDIQFTVHDIMKEDNRVALYWTWEGTHRGEFAKIPATGRRVRQEGMVLYHFENGKVVQAKVLFDRLGVFQQLGAQPALPGTPKTAATVAAKG